MPECEDQDCGEEQGRRVTCYHCGLKVCRYCWHHNHGCYPGHRPSECRDLKSYRRYGKQWLARRRAQTLKRIATQEILLRSFEEWPCSECRKFVRTAKLYSDYRCPDCGRSFSSRIVGARQLINQEEKMAASRGGE